MRILLTGGTGFLGKHVLNLLVQDPRVTAIDAVSRSKQTHPSPKVRILKLDLSDPACTHQFTDSYDAVVHIAGMYSFRTTFAENYQQNVLATANVMAKLKEWNRERKVPVLFASTYGVGFGMEATVGEEPLHEFASKKIPYAFTKAVAERTVTDAQVPALVFRLGVLVGDTQRGEIEKFDGPYTLMKFLLAASRFKPLQYAKLLPVPARRDGVLPLVPVDCAACVFHDALFRADELTRKNPVRIYGVYDRHTVELESFSERLVREYFPRSHALFVPKPPERLIQLQEKLTGVPAEVFRFSTEPLDLENSQFQADFAHCRIPGFETYEKQFFEGFLRFIGENRGESS